MAIAKFGVVALKSISSFGTSVRLTPEATDIVFAIDSVPAIYGLTREPLVVFTSNILAILGLRSMYFMLGGAIGRFHLLRYGLAVVLIFVGLKMLWLDAWFGGKFPIGISLAIIGSILGAAVILSWLYPAVRPVSGHRVSVTRDGPHTTSSDAA